MWRRRHIWPGYATPADAVRYLASACDGAILRDGHGFSGDHVAYGHWLAALPDPSWGPTERAGAVQLVRIYQRQLVDAGFQPHEILRGRQPRRIRSRDVDQLQPRWAPDPTGLHPWRWWNGVRWTSQTSAGGDLAQRTNC